MFGFFATLYAILSQISAQFSSPEIILHLDVLKNCKEGQNLAMDIKKSVFFIDPKTGLQHIHMDLNVTENLPADLIGLINVEKCRSKESPDTCVKVASMKSKEPCSIRNSKHYGVKPFLDCLTPAMGCPAKKAFYKSRGCTMNFSMFKMFPLAGSYWRVQAELFNRRNKKLACALGSGMFKNNNGY